ncbi:hypothetical protein [Sulfitobacter marinus]|uniref:hypothetical protein n=1 Tax=Sulfitobacter marinus TaxID=394264 RepID=UPI000B27E1D1|nr:hypothetical protein [Sulfitobacter marinus]
MSQEEQSVKDRLEVRKSQANALCQSGITTELLDVIIGFEALEKFRRATPTDPNKLSNTTPNQERNQWKS